MTALIIRQPDGSAEGADPRKLGRAALEAAGHTKQPLLRAIRAKCIDCCCYQVSEVAKCTAVGCALWPFRFGTNPFTDRKGGVPPPRKKFRAMPNVSVDEGAL